MIYVVVCTSTGYLQSRKQSATLDTSYYSQPRVPAVPARKCSYGIVFILLMLKVNMCALENTTLSLPRNFK